MEPERLSIIHLTAAYRADGLGRQIIGQSRLLAPEGVRATIVGFRIGGDRSPLLEEAMAQGIICAELVSHHPWNPRQVTSLVRLVRRVGARALVTHGYKADLVGLAAARVARIRAIAYAHGWTGEDRRVQRKERLDRLALRHMDAVVAVSESTRRALAAIGVPPGRLVTIPNAVAASDEPVCRQAARRRLLAAFGLPASSRIIATAGRLSPEKAQGDFLRACAHLGGGTGDARFLVFGEGPERARLGEMAEALGIDGRAVFCGYRADFLELLPGADLFVLSSHSEQLPFVILEAFAAGVPVVATDVGGVSELAEPGVTALLAPPASPEQLAAVMEEALRDADATARRAEAARHLARTRYSSTANAQRFAALVRQLVMCPDKEKLRDFA